MIGAGHCPSSPPHILRRSGHKQSFYLSSSRYSDIQTFAPNTISCWLVVAGIRAAAGAALPSNTPHHRCASYLQRHQERVSRRHQECPRLLDTEQSLLVLLQNPPEQTEAAQETPAGLRNVQCVTYCCGKIIINELVKWQIEYEEDEYKMISMYSSSICSSLLPEFSFNGQCS